MSNINCAVTVMPIHEGKLGFIRRNKEDSLSGLLVAPGGKVEPDDGTDIEGVPYFSVEEAAIRELHEEAGVVIIRSDLTYFCSLTLPNGRVVISFATCAVQPNSTTKLEWYSAEEIASRDDFAPGMKEESLMFLAKQGY